MKEHSVILKVSRADIEPAPETTFPVWLAVGGTSKPSAQGGSHAKSGRHFASKYLFSVTHFGTH